MKKLPPFKNSKLLAPLREAMGRLLAKPSLITAPAPRVVIFIGHFKTGSTSIQNFLASNYLRLLQAGILYPSVDAQGVARNMQVLLSGADRSTVGSGLNVIEPHNALALRLKTEEDGHGVPPYYPNVPDGFQMLELLRNQVEALRPRTVILCAEVFALLGMTPNRSGVMRLAQLFGTYDVTIYCNLRRPDEYLSSWHRQRLKFGAKIRRLSDGGFKGYLGTPHVEQAQMIEGWRTDHFPNAKFVIRNFDDVRAAGGSIADFVEHSGVSFPKNLVIPKDQNPSIPSAFAEIGRRAVHDLDPQLARRTVQWLTRARTRVDHPSDPEVEMLGRTNRDVLVRAFARIGPHLDQLSGRTPFYPNLAELGRLSPIDDLDAAERALPLLLRDASGHGLPDDIIVWLRDLAEQGSLRERSMPASGAANSK